MELPEEMKEYRDSTVVNDSTKLYYHIGVKGYNPSLAFADFTLPYVTTTETIVKKKSPVEFSWGLVGGVGYGVINRKPDVFVGLGVSLNFNFGNSKRGRRRFFVAYPGKLPHNIGANNNLDAKEDRENYAESD